MRLELMSTLAEHYGISALKQACKNSWLESEFLPRPALIKREILAVIEVQREQQRRTAKQRLDEENEQHFWAWIDERLADPENAGMTEQQILDTVKVPGYTGRKARKRKK